MELLSVGHSPFCISALEPCELEENVYWSASVLLPPPAALGQTVRRPHDEVLALYRSGACIPFTPIE